MWAPSFIDVAIHVSIYLFIYPCICRCIDGNTYGSMATTGISQVVAGM